VAVKLAVGDRVELRRHTTVRYPDESHVEFPAGLRGTVIERGETGEPLMGVAVRFDLLPDNPVLCSQIELRKLNLLEVIAEAAI
jgi:hypothetical protein